jgi:gamma-glutamylcyclotransferase (GGCT)/AIG2-like uncharacterized protein YtfP
MFPVGLISTLFVYGTLRPGDARWHFLEPYAADEGTPDAVVGSLFDTGRGYPAAVFDHRARPGDLIHGRRYLLHPDRLDDALAALDEEESSVTGLYRRTLVTTQAGLIAWAYQYGDGLELTPIPSGRWDDR